MNLKLITDAPAFQDKYKIDDDAFNHEVIADTLFDIIQGNEPPLTIGLYGGWGVGKSTIINLLRHKITDLGNNDAFVYFNAWAYSGDSFRRQFLISLVEGIVTDPVERRIELDEIIKLNYAQVYNIDPGITIAETVQGLNKIEKITATIKQVYGEFCRAWKKIKISEIGYVRLSISIVFAILSLLFIILGSTEMKTWGAASFLLSAASLFAPSIENLLVLTKNEVYDAKLIFPEQFEEKYVNLLEQYVPKPRKVIIVIDDLDRCDANTIKDVLVTLKNFFGKEDERSFFVTPIDDSAVIEMFKGENKNFGYEQLRKYFNVSVRIPVIFPEDIIGFSRKISKEYEISTNVAFIGAIGNCRDARKIKHFLNIYKVKYFIAKKRLDKGYLHGITEDDLEEPLAKLALLEYQFPEFHSFFNEHPETEDLFTGWARTGNFPEQLFEWRSELQIKKGEEALFWMNNKGLREFLNYTSDVPLHNVEQLIGLKSSASQFQLGDLGKSLSQALTSTEYEQFLNQIEDKIFIAQGDTLVQRLSEYIYSNNAKAEIGLLQKRAAELSMMILQSKKLKAIAHNELLRKVVALLDTDKPVLSVAQNAIVLLDNYDKLKDSLRKIVSKGIYIEIFETNDYQDVALQVIAHPNFRLAMNYHDDLKKKFSHSLKSWYEAESEDLQSEILQDIISLYNENPDFKDRDIKIVSKAFLIKIIRDLKEEDNASVLEYNSSRIDFLLNKNLNLDFNTVIDEIGLKISSVIDKNIVTNTINSPLLTILNFCSSMPLPLPLEESIMISMCEKIFSNIPNFGSISDKTLLMSLATRCIVSIKGKGDKERIKKQYRDQILPSAEIIKSILKDIEENVDYQGNEFIAYIVQELWNNLDNRFKESNTIYREYATVCTKYHDLIDKSKYFSNYQDQIVTGSQDIISSWREIILSTYPKFEETQQSDYLGSVFLRATNHTVDEPFVELLLALLIDLIHVSTPSLEEKYYHEVVSQLTNDNKHLREFVASILPSMNSDLINESKRYLVNSLLPKLLDKDNISQYSASLNICIEMSDTVQSHVWERAAAVLIQKLPDPSNSIEDRIVLLNLLDNIHSTIPNGRDLSRVLYTYKDTGDDTSLTTKAYEKYDMLISKGVIPKHENI